MVRCLIVFIFPFRANKQSAHALIAGIFNVNRDAVLPLRDPVEFETTPAQIENMIPNERHAHEFLNF